MGPFRDSQVKELEVDKLVASFTDQTGSPLKYVMIPRGTPNKIIQALIGLKVSTLYHSGTVDIETDLDSFPLRDFVVFDLLKNGKGFDSIMKLGKFLDDTGKNLFSLKECLNITSPRLAQCGENMSFEAKLELMRTFVVSSRSNYDYYDDTSIWEISRTNILGSSADKWRQRQILLQRFITSFKVKFVGENGIDAGGLTKEWASLISTEGFGNGSTYFEEIQAEENFVIPKSISVPQTLNYLSNFEFLGSFIGKVLSNGNTSECNFPDFLLKLMMGKKPNYHDLKQIDPKLFDSLKLSVAETIQDESSITANSFSYIREKEDGTKEDIIMKAGSDGRAMSVTEENKFEYLRLMFEAKVSTPQIKSFVQGFRKAMAIQSMPIQKFKAKEMRLFITGATTIDVTDWKNNSIYSGYQYSDREIVWFWEIVESFDDEKRRKLLKWVTGCRNAPMQGFAHLIGSGGIVYRFKISRHGFDINRLPQSHTCFNTIDLPPYSSKETMQEKIEMAICNDSFEMA